MSIEGQGKPPVSIEGQGKANSECGEAGENLLQLLRARGKRPVSIEGQGKASSEY